MNETKTKDQRRVGQPLASPKRRFKYHSGGRMPLSDGPLVSLTVIIPQSLYRDLLQLSERFISPRLKKPYGLASLSRVLCEIRKSEIKEASAEEIIEGLKQARGSPGRSGFSVDVVRIQLLLREHIIVACNKRASEIARSDVQTATVVRWLLGRAVSRWANDQDFYDYLPAEDKDLLSTSGG